MEAGCEKNAPELGCKRRSKVPKFSSKDSPYLPNILNFSDLGIEVKDFGASWRDGVAFLAIIDAIKANLINLAELKKASNRIRLETAFDVAERDLGISRLLDPEDVDVPKPDERSIMTYVAQFLHKYPEPRSTGPDAIAALQEEYNRLLSWLVKKTQFLEHLQQTNSLPMDYNEFQAFRNEVDEKEAVYEKLKALIESQSIVSITKVREVANT